MNVFEIALTILPPVLIMVALGVVLDKYLKLNLDTLNQVVFTVFAPMLVFEKILISTLTWNDILRTGLFTLMHLIIMGSITYPFWKFLRNKASIISLSAMFFNAGNIGLPVAYLAYGDLGIQTMAIILMIQNLACFTLGVFLLNKENVSYGKAFLELLKVPVVYALFAALVIRSFFESLPETLMLPVQSLANGLIPVALLCLGIQINRTPFLKHSGAVLATIPIRLLISPLVALGLLVFLFNFKSPINSICVLAAGMPVATNVFVLARKYNQHAEASSQVILWTTLLSAITIPIIIFLVS